MQNKYVGDIGDYGKYGLLRALCSPPKTDGGPELSLGVVWYLVPNHGSPGDGRYTDYLKDPDRFRPSDPPLFDCLKEIVDDPQRRNVQSIRQAGLLPGAKFYEGCLTFRDVPLQRRVAHRKQWLRAAIEEVAGRALVFVDPDNGLQVKSASRHSTKGTNYVYYDELHDYVSQSQSVVVYQHMPRESPDVYVRWRVKELREKVKIRGALWALLWHPYSPRVYFIIPNGREAVLRPRIEAMLKGPWGQDRPEGPHFEPVLFP